MSENHADPASRRIQGRVHTPRVNDAARGRVYESQSGNPTISASDFGYFDPAEPFAEFAGNLPHWRQEGVTYFVTFRLADSLPQAKLAQWQREREEWVRSHPEPWSDSTRVAYHRQFTARIEKWIDAGYGACILTRPDVRDEIVRALQHFDGQRYWLDSWIVMPNHVHAIVTPLPDNMLSDILHSWKSYSAHALKALSPGRCRRLWQKESFDHIVRSADHLQRFREYIARNPIGLEAHRYTLRDARLP
jgi:REP element-mobilizing transposase RayT